MKTEDTRAALKASRAAARRESSSGLDACDQDGALPHAGHKLIDLQRAGWIGTDNFPEPAMCIHILH